MASYIFTDRAQVLVNGIVIYPTDTVVRVEFSLMAGARLVEDTMTTDGSSAGYTYGNVSGSINLTIKIPQGVQFNSTGLDRNVYLTQIVNIQLVPFAPVVLNGVTGNSIELINCKPTGNISGGYRGVGNPEEITIVYSCTDYRFLASIPPGL